MPLKRVSLPLAAALLLFTTGPASAGLTERLGRDLGRGLGQGAVEKLQPALAHTLADVDSRLMTHETRIDNIAQGLINQTSSELGVRLDQVDGILEQRLLQTQLGVSQVLDHGLDRIDGVARVRIAQLNESLAGRISQAGNEVQEALQTADTILKTRIADIDTAVARSIDQADGALEARIDQLDEVAGRRLGNVDVIATKQRLGFEQSVTRAVWLCALVAFVVVVLWSLWREYLKKANEIASRPPGTDRARAYVVTLGKPLLRQLGVGAVVAVLLALLPGWLPMAAQEDRAQLVEHHEQELARSVAQLDFVHVRYHASQLEFLEPNNTTRYKATVAKAGLLRDLLSRPTALATTAGVASVLEQTKAAERLLTRPDSDLRTVRAMLLWQQESSRRGAHRAASLAARALWASPRGFTLAPIARLIVRSYLHAPELDADATEQLARLAQSLSLPSNQERLLEQRAELETLEDRSGLDALLASRRAETSASAYEGVSLLFGLLQELDRAASVEYVSMIKAQTEFLQLGEGAPKAALDAARKRRNHHAEQVVRAFETLDRQLLATPLLRSNAMVLSVFRCNDAFLTHALWYTTQPETRSFPQPLSALKDDGQIALKLALAPARTVWARRYQALLEGPARELIELQEASRFEDFERKALAFEAAYAEMMGVSSRASEGAKGKGGKPVSTTSPLLLRVRAASAAAALDLYVGSDDTRRPLSLAILEPVFSDQQLDATRADEGARSELQEAFMELEDRLLTRGTPLITFPDAGAS